MAGVKGRSGTNKNKEKPYAEALRMELAAAGDNHKALRRIAAAHIKLAESGDMPAIREIADRLDGKPAQDTTVTVYREPREMSDNELTDIAAGSGSGAAEAPIDSSRLN